MAASTRMIDQIRYKCFQELCIVEKIVQIIKTAIPRSTEAQTTKKAQTLMINLIETP